MQVVALAGGVGAAKFLSGLVRVMPADDLTIVVNTGDDFHWMGLYVCPDLDTVTYTLAGLANPQTGWGIRDDSYRVLGRLKNLGSEAWFQIGDLDLATHIYRTEQLRSGRSLSDITRHFCELSGIPSRILPMSDSLVPTLVHTAEGTLPFQEYFVKRRCGPSVLGFTFQGIEDARPAPGVIEALEAAQAVIICPSNPFISIGPILAVPGLRETLRRIQARIAAITPIIAGAAVKGPTAAMLKELGFSVSAAGVAKLYSDFIDVFVLDRRDEPLRAEIEALGMSVRTASTLMDSDEARTGLARRVMGILR